MKSRKNDLHESVKEIMSEEEFESEIEKRYEDYQGLLSREAISLLILDEHGKGLTRIQSITQLKDGDSVSLEITVKDTGIIREFLKKNGKTGRVVNIAVTDGKGDCRLTLWDKDTEAVKTGIIRIGSRIKIVNGYVKNSGFGPEINIGRWGTYEVLK